MSSSKIENLIHQSFDELYLQRSMKLREVSLSDLLRNQNLYLLCATNDSSVSSIIEKMLLEHLSSSDENIFGQTFLESIANIERDDTAFSGEKSHVADEAIALVNLMRDCPIQHRTDFEKEWAKALNRFEHDFLNKFGNPDGTIDWENLLRYNSGKENVPWVSKVMPVTVEDQEDENNDDEVGDIDYGNEGYG
jgi:type II restriction endonuclease EcoO109I-like protein